MEGSRPRLRAMFRRIGAAVVVWLVLPQIGCAADLARHGDHWRHRRAGFAIEDAAHAAPGWRQVEVPDALLAYRGPDGARMSLSFRCARTPADTRVLARHLLIGLAGRRIVDEGPVDLDGVPAWVQHVTAREGPHTVELKTVTRPIGRCTADWVLVSTSGVAAVEPDFDRWWSTFRASSADVANAGAP